MKLGIDCLKIFFFFEGTVCFNAKKMEKKKCRISSYFFSIFCKPRELQVYQLSIV